MSTLSTPSITGFGVSAQLRADFDMLREVSVDTTDSYTSGSSINKFSSASVDLLAQQLVCRNYSNACYELAHLCWAILHSKTISHQQSCLNVQSSQQVLLDYFWIQQVCTKNSFIAYFESRKLANSSITGANFSVHDGFLQLCIHQHKFAISANRANFLSCLMEWLICVVHDLLPTLHNTLFGKGHNAISQMASTLQQEIYRYLGDHLPAAKLQKRYRLFEQFYTHLHNAHKTVTNDSILAFWQQHCEREGFTKYSAAVYESLAYLDAIDSVRTSQHLQFAQSIELDQELKDNNDDSLENSVISHANEAFLTHIQYSSTQTQLPLMLLTQRPKVFNKAQHELAECIALYPTYFPDFTLSWLRCQSFGKWQNKLIQATRKDNIKALSEYTLDDYNEIKTRTLHMLANSQQTLMAIVAIMLDENPMQALLLLLTISNSVANMREHKTRLQEILDKTDEINAASLARLRLAQPWFAKILNDCNIALKQINRNGFTANTRLEQYEYIDTVKDLLRLNQKLSTVLARFIKQNLNEAAKFSSERFIFTDVFEKLYAQNNH